ncbi:class I SAM-dependent methyltransferase [Sediminitomix flava]|uniref:Methyltransferase family protein n=1 Tax=Sediminitomix flava TaxID=379075 RepID=A0A315Z1M8_SEDFL|nr:class I SAM-dependent methyltransferase [Sediminitomix flava]PWJ36030.1 methyltransferase family protein [Sediminitomix flava]
MEVNKTAEKDWFADWFNTPYYHLLYRNRDFSEAEFFINNLIEKLEVKPEHKVMDLACGKGRHSIFLYKAGLDVTGLDLSMESIQYAKQFENERLHFVQHDMREVYQTKGFDFIFNMFTSFGYFMEDEEDQKAISAVAQNLKTGGKLVIDFFNTSKVISTLPNRNITPRDHIDFHIHKYLQDERYIIKEIAFEDKGKSHFYSERVKALHKDDFVKYFEKAGLSCQQIYGSYSLDPFDIENSDRMILVAEKL